MLQLDRVRSSALFAGLVAVVFALGCSEQSCEQYQGDQYDFYRGDRCPLLIHNGRVELYPGVVTMPPSIPAEPGATAEAESSRIVSVRGWIDQRKTIPASGHHVDLSVEACAPQDGLGALSIRLEAITTSDEPECEVTNQQVVRCILDSDGQASLRVVAGNVLSDGSHTCLWARSGIDDNGEPLQSLAEIEVRYGLEDLALALEPLLASPLSCGTVDRPCGPIEQPEPSAALCAEGAACEALVQFIDLSAALQYHGAQASGIDETIELSIASSDGAGAVWFAVDGDCQEARATTVQVGVAASTGRSPDLRVCADGRGAEVAVRAQSLRAPALKAALSARFLRAPARVAPAEVIAEDTQGSGVYRVKIHDCSDAALPGVELQASLDDGQSFGGTCVTDAFGVCLLEIPKDPGLSPDKLLIRVDAVQAECEIPIQ